MIADPLDSTKKHAPTVHTILQCLLDVVSKCASDISWLRQLFEAVTSSLSSGVLLSSNYFMPVAHMSEGKIESEDQTMILPLGNIFEN
jgi:hypothetical protein